MLAGISMVAVSEALYLAKRLGLDPKKFFEIASTSSGQSWALTSYAPEPGLGAVCACQSRLRGRFRVRTDAEGLAAGRAGCHREPFSCVLGAAAASVYAMHCAAGEGDSTSSSVIQIALPSPRVLDRTRT